jgi:hypothetical protein
MENLEKYHYCPVMDQTDDYSEHDEGDIREHVIWLNQNPSPEQRSAYWKVH